VSGPVGLLASGEEKGARAEEAEALVAGRRATEEEVAEASEGKVVEEVKEARAGAGAMNMTKHLWSGAVAAMVSRYCRFVLLCSDV
jgi:hypothetical protein